MQPDVTAVGDCGLVWRESGAVSVGCRMKGRMEAAVCWKSKNQDMTTVGFLVKGELYSKMKLSPASAEHAGRREF